MKRALTKRGLSPTPGSAVSRGCAEAPAFVFALPGEKAAQELPIEDEGVSSGEGSAPVAMCGTLIPFSLRRRPSPLKGEGGVTACPAIRQTGFIG